MNHGGTEAQRDKKGGPKVLWIAAFFVPLCLCASVVHTYAQSRKNPKDGLTYVSIPPGSFQMGCSEGDKECYEDERPTHTVKISTGFWMGQTEVTVAAFQKFAQAKAIPIPPDQKGGK